MEQHHHQNLQRMALAGSRSNHLNHHPFEPAAPMIHPQPPPMATTNSNLLFSPSESPQVQHKNILQRLSQEIEKSGAHKVRYVDSELYLRNQEPTRSPLVQQPASEVQTTTLNIGGSTINSRQSSSSSATNNRIPTVNSTGGDNNQFDQIASTGAVNSNNNNNLQRLTESTSGPNLTKSNGNCQVCLIREVRQDLMNINKMVQERNEQIVKLKDKFKDRCLRSYFERQTSPK